MKRVSLHCLFLLALTAMIGAGQTISPASMPSARVGVGFVQTLTLSPSDPGTVWDLVSGQLPPGLNFNPQGTTASITGQGTQTGAYTFLVSATPTGGAPPASRVYTIIVSPMSITTVSMADGAVGIPYAASMGLAGGFSGYTWTFDAGTVANGLSIAPFTGLITGTPQLSGVFPINIKVTDSGTPVNTATRSFTWIVAGAASINTSSLPAGEVGVLYSQSLAASGGTLPYIWSLATGSTLPPGLQLNAATGVIAGTPTLDGAYPFTIQVVDATSAAASRPLSITVQPPLAITTTSLPGGSVGSAYSQAVQSSGGLTPITWAVTSGVLPPGLTLNSSSGVISGPAASEGSQTFTVAATDALGATAFRELTLQITTLAITTESLLPDASQSVAYSTVLAAAGGTGFSWALSAGTLPAGLNLDAATGTIAGTPGTAGTSTFTITVTSTAPPASVSKLFSITVAAGPPAPLPSSITLTVPGAPGPAQQPALAVTLGSSYPLTINGTVTLAFAAEGSGADNPEVRFSNGTRTSAWTFAPGSTTSSASALSILTGTVAGTITLTAHLTDSTGRDVTPTATPVRTIVLSQGVPVITSVRIATASGGFNFIVSGYSTTREISSGTFHFNPAPGATLTTGDFTVPLTSAFAAWYGNSQSSNTGSQFVLTVPFLVQGTPLPIASGTVQLANARGASAVSTPAIP